MIALVLTLACLCMQVGSLEPKTMGESMQIYNLWIVEAGKHNYTVAGMFLALLLTCPLNIKAILSFNDRMMQSKLCTYCILLLLAWHAILGVCLWLLSSDELMFRANIAMCLPLICIIFYAMARKAILADEKLVRDADRIR